MERLTMTHRVVAGTILISLAGDLDAIAAQELESYLDRLDRRTGTHVVFDLEEVPFIDSAGLRVLINAHVYAEGHGGSVRLAAMRLRSLRILEITQLDSYLPVHPTVADALRAVLAGEQPGEAGPDAAGAAPA